MKYFCAVILLVTLFSGCYTITEYDYVVKDTRQRSLFIDTMHCELLIEIDPYAEDSGRLDVRIEGYSATTGCSIEELAVHFSVCDEDGVCTKALQVDCVQVSAPLHALVFYPQPSDSIRFLSLPDSIHNSIFTDSTCMRNVYTTFWFGVDAWSGPEFAQLTLKALLNVNGQKITVHHTYEFVTEEFKSHIAQPIHGKFFCYRTQPKEIPVIRNATL